MYIFIFLHIYKQIVAQDKIEVKVLRNILTLIKVKHQTRTNLMCIELKDIHTYKQ